MITNLRKIVIHMTRMTIYAMIVCQAFAMTFSSDSKAQRSMLAEIPIHIDNNGNDEWQLIDLISFIESKSDFIFSYSENRIESLKVKLIQEDWVMMDLLKEISIQGNISIKRVNENISLNKVNGFFSSPVVSEVVLDQIAIQGIVTDENGDPLPGATIQEKGSTNGTITNVEGEFTLNVPEDATLTISFVGYETQEIAVNNRSRIDLQLAVDSEQLDEVVVIGYGTRKKSDVTGAISSVNAEEITAIPSANVVEALQGRAAGLQITQSDGEPGGSGLNILIRGQRSLTASNSPLVVVDGIPLADLGGGGNLNDFNTNDIESVEILKDASASAIYGARGANGVILITTKRGKAGKTSVTYSGQYGFTDVANPIEVYNGDEYAQFRREAFRTNGVTDDSQIFTPEVLEIINDGAYTDFLDEIISPGSLQSHNFSVSGGSEKLRTALSLGYFEEKGLIETSKFQRGTFKLSVDYSPTEKFNVSSNINLSRRYQDLTTPSLIDAVIGSPFTQVRDENGELIRGDEDFRNPLTVIELDQVDRWRNRTFGNVTATYEIIKGLKFSTNLAVDFSSTQQGEYLDFSFVTNQSNEADIDYGSSFAYTIENILNYNRTFGQDHTIRATLLQSIQESRNDGIGIVTSELPTRLLLYDGLTLGQPFARNRDLTEWALESYMARFEYSFTDRYLMTLTGRIDGSSKFGAGNKYGFFPSAAFAWKLHREAFFSNVEAFNELKLRVSYGQIGNQEIPVFRSLAATTGVGYVFGSSSLIGSVPSRLANEDLRWETTTSLNLGIDFGLYDDRVFGSVELFSSETDDLLLDRNIPAHLGFTRALTNIGVVKNKGVDVTLTGSPVDIGGFKWEISANVASNRNEILALEGSVDEDGNPLDDIGNSWFIGEPIGVIYDFVYDGIWQTGEDIANSAQPNADPGDIKIKDLNEDGMINDEDRAILGSNVPDWYGGLTNTFSYKGFELSIFINTVQGVLRRNELLTSPFANDAAVWNAVKQNYWTPENPSNDWPRPNSNRVRNPFSSALTYEDASYVALRNVTLAYNFQPQLLEKIGISSFRMYITGTNLNYWTDFRNYSPEISARGGNNGGFYPLAKSFVMGLNLGF